MKRPNFIGLVVASMCGLATREAAAAIAVSPPQLTWAQRIEQEIAGGKGRRFGALGHAKHCGGGYDHLYTVEMAAERAARCAKICGGCRYDNSLAVWRNPDHERPPKHFLDALEEEPYCLTFHNQPTYRQRVLTQRRKLASTTARQSA